MKNWIALIAFLTLCNSTVAQQKDTASIAMYPFGLEVNILGQGSLMSVMMEKRFRSNGRSFIAGRIGLGYQEEFCLFDCSQANRYLTVPHSMTINLGGWSHWFEMGLGGIYLSDSPVSRYNVFPIIGYRYMSQTPNRFFFRLAIHAPLEGWSSQDYLFWPAGLSFGASL